MKEFHLSLLEIDSMTDEEIGLMLDRLSDFYSEQAKQAKTGKTITEKEAIHNMGLKIEPYPNRS